MNLRQLTNLVAVADAGSITRAARALNVSQPALTKSIRDLERSVGSPLFIREPRGVAPTESGDSLIARARSIAAELNRARADLDALRGGAAGHVAVGASPVIAADLAPRALARLLADTPGLSVAITEGANRSLLPMLRMGDLDFVVGPLSGEGPQPGLTEEFLYYNELAIIARAGHPLSGAVELTFRDIQGAAWILPPRTVAPRMQFDNGFRAAGLKPPQTAVETTAIACVKQLLLQTDRLTVLPPQLVRQEVELGQISVLPVIWRAPWRPMGVTRREGGTLSPAAGAMIACLRNEVRLGGWPEDPPSA
jgi:DNA-binding transcriptional LysR family regulator